MKYFDLLNLKSKYTQVLQQIVAMEEQDTKNIYLSECAQNVSKLFASYYFDKKATTIIYITPSIYEASRAYEILLDMLGTDKVSFFPVEEFISSELVATSEAFRLARMLTIYHIVNEIPQVIVTNTEGLTRQLMPKSKLKEAILRYRTNDSVKREDLIENLIIRGYKKVSITSTSGTFSVRGSLIDVFPINENQPIRINFFDDEIETIKKIDVETQMSTEKIHEIEIFPLYEIYYEKSQIEDIKKRILKENQLSDRIHIALENIENYQNLEQLYMYMPYITNCYQPLIRLIEKPICFYEDYQSCIEHEKAMMMEISEYLIQTKAKVEQHFFVELKEVLYDSKLNIFTSLFRNALHDVKLDYHYPLETLNCFEYNNNIKSMLEDLKANANKCYLVTHTDEKKLMFLQETFKANNIN